jgi:hypothetical protein
MFASSFDRNCQTNSTSACAVVLAALLGCGARSDLPRPCWLPLDGRETNIVFAAEQGNIVWGPRNEGGPTLAEFEAEFLRTIATRINQSQHVGGFIHPQPGFGVEHACLPRIPIQTSVQAGGATMFFRELLTRATRPDTEACGCQYEAFQTAAQLVTDPTRDYIVVPMIAVPQCSTPPDEFLSTFLTNPRFTVAIVGVVPTIASVGGPHASLTLWGRRTEMPNTRGNLAFFWVREPEVFAEQLLARIDRNRRCSLRLPDTFRVGALRDVRLTAEDNSTRSVSMSASDGWTIADPTKMKLNGPSCDWAVEHRATVAVRLTNCPSDYR